MKKSPHWKWLGRWSAVILLAIITWYFIMELPTAEVPTMKLPPKLIKSYVQMGQEYDVPWSYLAAMDEVENQYRNTTSQRIQQRAEKIKTLLQDKKIPHSQTHQVISLLFSGPQAKEIEHIAASYEWGAPMLAEPYAFPFRLKDRAKVKYSDTWGASRTFGGNRKHEGTDLMTKKGIPLIAVTDGLIIRKGWNQLGGWRISLLDFKHPQVVYYYAHLQDFAENIKVGSRVKKGDIVGYVGDSGYGPEGTTGQFPSHLHFGIYIRKGWFQVASQTINPYPFLVTWDPYKK